MAKADTETAEPPQFTGTVVHSRDFVDGSEMAGRDVLVLGVGNSALDIALVAVRSKARSVRVVYRKPAIIMPVSSADGKPVDTYLNSRAFLDAPKMLQEYLFFSPVQATMKEFNRAGMPPIPEGTPGFQIRLSNLKEHQAWISALKEKKIEFCQKVRRFHERSVTCGGEDDAPITTVPVVCCTGYSLEFPFLSADVKQSFMKSYGVGVSGNLMIAPNAANPCCTCKSAFKHRLKLVVVL